MVRRGGALLPTVVPTDSRPLSWPPIGALPRNRLASSATGGASPISPTPRLHQPAYMRRAACPHTAVFTQKNKREATLPSCKDTKLLIRSHGLDDLDLTAIVGTALRAHSVRQMQRTALGAGHQTGSRQLPHGAASLVASLLDMKRSKALISIFAGVLAAATLVSLICYGFIDFLRFLI